MSVSLTRLINTKLNEIEKRKTKVTTDQKVEPFYLTLKEVTSMTALGKSSIYRLEQQGQFPNRLTLNKSRVVWAYKDVHAWCIMVEKLKGYPEKGHYAY